LLFSFLIIYLSINLSRIIKITIHYPMKNIICFFLELFRRYLKTIQKLRIIAVLII